MAVAYFMIHVANASTPMAKFFPISSAGPQVSNKGELAIFIVGFSVRRILRSQDAGASMLIFCRNIGCGVTYVRLA